MCRFNDFLFKFYFFNTLGTVFEAVVIGYLAFYIFDLDSLFKINLVLLILLFGVITVWKRRRFLSGLALVGLIWMALLPQWNRTGHTVGYFRQRMPAPWHFQKVFHLPVLKKYDTVFFDDGPNATVSILSFTSEKETEKIQQIQKAIPEVTHSYAVMVNGKADGHSIKDFSIMVLLASLGYLFLPDKPALSSSVIGLRTGISAGVLGKLEDMIEVVALEISPAVIAALKSVKIK